MDLETIKAIFGITKFAKNEPDNEYRADGEALIWIGEEKKDVAISALVKICEEYRNGDMASETHPSIRDRINAVKLPAASSWASE